MHEMDPALLDKFFNNRCTAEEHRQVLEWLNTDEGRRYLLNAVQRDLEKGDAQQELAQTSRSEALFQRILTTAQQQEIPLRRRRRWQGYALLKAAAVITGVVALSLAAWKMYLQNRLVTYKTAYGEVRTLTLPDQSVVTLNGNSTLQYRRYWNTAKDREIWVQGEAFFDVKPAARKRFLVHTSHHINVEVLGTTFNVLDREGRTQVVLNSGKVRLSSSSRAIPAPIIMQPGELIEVKANTLSYHKKHINAAAYASWKNHRLEFNNTELVQVAQVLHETYGITVIIKDSTLLHQQFSGTVPSENANMLLDGLSQLFDLKITRQNATVNIEKNHQ
jgi:ferric-dicitrate binding protein FerR (iron transport regulator)